MAQPNNRSNPSNQPSKSPTTREGDEPQDIREAKPKHDHVDSKDGGRDRNPGDMQADKKSGSTGAGGRNPGDMQSETKSGSTDARNAGGMKSDQRSGSTDARGAGGSDRNTGEKRLGEQKETDPKGTGFDESESELDDEAGDPKFTGENDTNEKSKTTDGSHIKNPQPRTR